MMESGTSLGRAGGSEIRWMAAQTSLRWTGHSRGASMPRRTLSPRISITVIRMSSLMTIDSFFLRDRTNMVMSQAPEEIGLAGGHSAGSPQFPMIENFLEQPALGQRGTLIAK